MNKGITILYVDDEDINLFLFERSFNAYYNIITAISAAEGLKALDNHGDDIIVVVSDLKMPGMDGIEFIRLAKEKFNSIYYFLLTGFDYSPEIDAALKTKLIDRFFTKPFDVTAIREAVDSLSGGVLENS